MGTLIFRTFAPGLAALMVMFSVFVLLRGHNEPGGGFIGGLIAASGFAIYGIANGVENVREALYFRPLSISATGVLLAALSGIPALLQAKPYLTGLWWFPHFGGVELALSTPLLFDIGVWLGVVGAVIAIALALEEREG
ncbi:MAG: Na+/H+ antiporter subunit B [Dichotomicrobium sp.]